MLQSLVSCVERLLDDKSITFLEFERVSFVFPCHEQVDELPPPCSKAFVDMRKERRARAQLELSQTAPFQTGEQAELRCVGADGTQDQVGWLKDGARLELVGQPRFVVSPIGVELH